MSKTAAHPPIPHLDQSSFNRRCAEKRRLRVKLFYARDFRALMLKFGKLALVDELSGTPGQVVPVRPEAPDELEVDR